VGFYFVRLARSEESIAAWIMGVQDFLPAWLADDH
jgi:hypothetical protein